MRLLCVGRHRYLSEHIGRYFEAFGVDTLACVGLDEALRRVTTDLPDAVVCDYDLLTPAQIASWEKHPVAANVPVIAVSLTRPQNEAHLHHARALIAFLYLPTLDADEALRTLSVIRQRSGGIQPPPILTWPETSPAVQLR